MRFYDCTPAPSPRRARIFIAEKGLEIETIQIDLRGGEQMTPEFRIINPRCTVPVLVLDDGTAITENAGIASYLEECYPEPPLLGRDPVDKALVASWNARIEFDGLLAVAEAFRNSAKGMKNRGITGPVNYDQIPALVDRGRNRVKHFLTDLNGHLEGRDFIVGHDYSMADITAQVTVDFASWIKVQIPDDYLNLKRWHAAVSARPSATA